MDRRTIWEAAASLRAARGDLDAPGYASAQALERAACGDEAGRVRWQAIADELRFLGRPPGTCTQDVYDSARALLGQHGDAEALRVLDRRAATPSGIHPGVHARVRAAVVALARREPRPGEAIQ